MGTQCAYPVHLSGGGQVNCKRLEEEAATDAGRGSCCPYFLCILSASACGPGDGFAVSMGLRHGGPWHSCAHISNSHLLRTSSILHGVPKGSAGCSFPHFQAKPCGAPRAPTIWPRQGGGRTLLDRCFCLAFLTAFTSFFGYQQKLQLTVGYFVFLIFEQICFKEND